MSIQKLTLLFCGLFAFMMAWSLGLAAPLMDWLNPESEMTRYLISKGVLTLAIAAALWRLKLFTAIGFAPGMGWASYVIGLPLLVLGVLMFFEPGRPVLTPSDLAGWAIVVLFVAFTEETLFRGILWQALSGASVWRRAIITSLLLGLAHVIPAIGAFGWSIAVVYGLSATGIGMVFAAMRERAGTIWSVIIVHAVFDIAAISASGSVEALLDPGLETYLRFLSAALVFTIWGGGAIYLMERRARRDKNQTEPLVVQASISGAEKEI